MTTLTVLESAAGNAVGTNLMSGNRVQSAPIFRKVSKIGVVGSAAIGDASVDLFYGSTYVGTFFNTTAGAVLPLEARDIVEVGGDLLLEPSEPLNILISDAGATTTLRVTLEIEEYPELS